MYTPHKLVVGVNTGILIDFNIATSLKYGDVPLHNTGSPIKVTDHFPDFGHRRPLGGEKSQARKRIKLEIAQKGKAL